VQPASPRIGSDDKDRYRAAARHAPLRIADQDRDGLRYSLNSHCAKSLAFVQQRSILEALGPERHDPEITRRMVDHSCHHALKAEKQPHLHTHKHDREYNANDRCDKPEPVVKQVFRRKLEDQWNDRLAGQ